MTQERLFPKTRPTVRQIVRESLAGFALRQRIREKKRSRRRTKEKPPAAVQTSMWEGE